MRRMLQDLAVMCYIVGERVGSILRREFVGRVVCQVDFPSVFVGFVEFG